MGNSSDYQDLLNSGSQSTARSFGVQHQQLLAKGQVFEDKAVARTESNENPAEEMPQEYEHGRILSKHACGYRKLRPR
jgi:hypothetical protein